MRALALDLDGVVNSISWMRRMPGDWQDHTPAVDPESVKLLDSLIQKLDLVVISSTWRKTMTVGAIRRSLMAKGLSQDSAKKIMAKTIVLPGEKKRGQEIVEWLKTQPKVTSLVVLDDDGDKLDMQPLAAWWVKVDNQWGLRDADVEKALQVLETPGP